MAPSIFAQQKHEKTTVDHFTQGLSNLLAVVNCLKQNGPDQCKNLESYINQASEETKAAEAEMNTLENAVRFEVQNLFVNVNKLEEKKKNIEIKLEELQIKLKCAQVNRDQAGKTLEIQMNYLAKSQDHLRQANEEVQENKEKIDRLLPSLSSSIIGGIILVVYKVALDNSRKVVSEVQKSVASGEQAVFDAYRAWEKCSQEVDSFETEIASVDEEKQEVVKEIGQTKEKQKTLNEQEQLLMKGALFLKRLYGKVGALNLIVDDSESLGNVLNEINTLIQHHMEEEEENVAFFFTAEVKELAANLQETVKPLAV